MYKGKLDTPKGRKGKRTARKVALSPGTAMELAALETLLLKAYAGSISVSDGAEHAAEPR